MTAEWVFKRWSLSIITDQSYVGFMPDGHDAYAALRYRDYRLLLIGAMLTSIGLEVQAVAVGWELYERTGSEWILGLTGLVQFLPVLFLALPAGQAADRFSRKVIY